MTPHHHPGPQAKDGETLKLLIRKATGRGNGRQEENPAWAKAYAKPSSRAIGAGRWVSLEPYVRSVMSHVCVWRE